MTVSYPGGGSVAAVLLDASRNVIRLAINGWDDTAEFRLVRGQWLSEEDEPVEVDSVADSWREDESAPAAGGLERLRPEYAPPVWVN